MNQRNHTQRHLVSGTGLFLAVTLLTATSGGEQVYLYQCGASAQLAENFILAPERPDLYFSVDIPVSPHTVVDNEDTGTWGSDGSWSQAQFNVTGRYMTDAVEPSAPNEDIALRLSKWQSVPDDLCGDAQADSEANDSGLSTDTGATADTGNTEAIETDDTFQFSWVDGACFGWNEFQVIPLEATAGDGSEYFEFSADVEEPWGIDVIFRLTLDGNGHAAIDFDFAYTLYEKESYPTRPGFLCNPNKDVPDRSPTRDTELCTLLELERWSWSEQTDPRQ